MSTTETTNPTAAEALYNLDGNFYLSMPLSDGSDFSRVPAGHPTYVRLTAEFATEAEARECAARFPKNLNLRVTTCSYRSIANEDGTYTRVQSWLVGGQQSLMPNESTGAVNETGVKRVRGWIAKCDPSIGGAPWKAQADTIDEAIAALDEVTRHAEQENAS